MLHLFSKRGAQCEKISFQLDNRLVEKEGIWRATLSHTLMASYCWNASRCSLNTSISPPPPPPPPPPLQFATSGQLLCSLTGHVEAPLNEKTYNHVESNYTTVIFSFESLLCFSSGKSFLLQMFVCLPVCQSVCLVHVVVGADKLASEAVGAAVDTLPLCSH